MLINVEQKHIDAGEWGECFTCPIALAIKDVLPDDVVVGVESEGVFTCLGGTNDIFYWDMPASARIFIEDFDAGLSVEPFTFELENERR